MLNKPNTPVINDVSVPQLPTHWLFESVVSKGNHGHSQPEQIQDEKQKMIEVQGLEQDSVIVHFEESEDQLKKVKCVSITEGLIIKHA